MDEGGEDLSKLIITAGDIFDNRGEIVEGASAQILDTNIDGLRELIFNPPTHGSGEFFINLSITDLEITQEAVVVIKIIDVQEPPVVDVDVNFFGKSRDGTNCMTSQKMGKTFLSQGRTDGNRQIQCG